MFAQGFSFQRKQILWKEIQKWSEWYRENNDTIKKKEKASLPHKELAKSIIEIKYTLVWINPYRLDIAHCEKD